MGSPQQLVLLLNSKRIEIQNFKVERADDENIRDECSHVEKESKVEEVVRATSLPEKTNIEEGLENKAELQRETHQEEDSQVVES